MRFSSLAEWLAWQETLHPSSIDLGLGRVQHVLDVLGWKRPQHPVITVGGTNGKGSCVALLDSILAAAGYRTGTFTSPHLHRYNERVHVSGAEILDASLVAAFQRIDAARGEITLTFFEFNAIAALLVFETAGLDVAILEVGMGGRLDAVNVVDADAALVVSVALDHCEWLGNDVETIGSEKAGIFRPGQPAVFGSREMPQSVQAAADLVGAKLEQLGRDFDFIVAPDRPSEEWSWRNADGPIEGLPRPALPGAIQYANAAAVVAVLRKLQARLPVTHEALLAGLRNVRLAGRFEVRAGAVTWIFDVAHNPAAAHVLAENLVAHSSDGRTLAVCGVLSDKDVESMVAELRSHVDVWILAGLSGPRAGALSGLAGRFNQLGIKIELVAADVMTACAAAQRLAGSGDRVVVFGSFLTVGPAREWFARQRQGRTSG